MKSYSNQFNNKGQLLAHVGKICKMFNNPCSLGIDQLEQTPEKYEWMQAMYNQDGSSSVCKWAPVIENPEAGFLQEA